jgi:putative nucleotidyltransferase with HDIG domain
MIKEPQIPLFDLIVCLADTMDLVSPSLTNHHKQVAYFASEIALELGLDVEKQTDIIMAGALHDIGALSLQERLETLDFEITESSTHTTTGAALLQSFKPLAHLAPVIQHHHRHWMNSKTNSSIPLESYILHVADRIAVLINKNAVVLSQAQFITDKIKSFSNTVFAPNVVNAFLNAAKKESFWLSGTSPSIFRLLRQKARLKTIQMDLDKLHELALFFSHIIDFRSKFTATHSAGVAASAESLAKLSHFCERECRMMKIAGLLHDLGKLAVPKEILEKTGALSPEEFAIIRSHTYHTYRILDTLENFDTINTWGAFHHERINGNGYPFHHNASVLSVGSRIMCVADVFTAIMEDRPYRPGMKSSDALTVLSTMAQANSLDNNIVHTLQTNFTEINAVRIREQKKAAEAYNTVVASR